MIGDLAAPVKPHSLTTKVTKERAPSRVCVFFVSFVTFVVNDCLAHSSQGYSLNPLNLLWIQLKIEDVQIHPHVAGIRRTS